jgi:hypothetical protein
MLKSLARHCLDLLPDGLRLSMDVGVVSLQDTRQKWRLPVHRVHGRLANGDLDGTLLYFGDLTQYRSWAANLFADDGEAGAAGTASLPEIWARKGEFAAADMMLCPINPLTERFFRRHGWHSIPLYVDCIIDLRRPIKELIRSRGAKDDLRVVRKLQYTSEILHGDDKLREFYERMLLPMVKNRHEERAHISEWDNVKRIAEDGFLLGVYRDGAWVAAILIGHEGGREVRLSNMGWRDGDKQLMKDRVVTALFFEAITWCQEQGFEGMNMGASLPFAADGPLNFKLKWGADLQAPQIVRHENEIEGVRGFMGAFVNLETAAGQSMLRHNPLLEKHQGGIRAIAWQSEVPKLFKHQIDRGFPWVDLSEGQG